MNKIPVFLLLILCISSCKTPEARKPESVSTGSFINESADRNKKLFSLEQDQIEAYITNQEEKLFIPSELGFWFSKDTIQQDSTLKTPNFGDLISYEHYIADLNGQIIYTREELKARDYAMDKQELFTGLREGLKLMKAGETYTFIFPSQKAYGYYGDENKIGANLPIVTQVTVNSITTN
ncbi:gliding motility-associated peptidyl-prolyl isomerase GldI [Lacinutrix neustonica]|uniref:Peptidyl-prolyl cis-trans isomerase n=1 Tax=Lacinutrix neustonica TaxID=2980107 RepID=A0A9E8SFD8_9FLAO|nr:gliding motility-associated peptidyl-prolyl isomerase GldI [Lacinutrix neustonica]WAC03304.1 gliding motility-associated peptidyl-prolyl isomerase GldI [Lacinutrix neustonica]